MVEVVADRKGACPLFYPPKFDYHYPYVLVKGKKVEKEVDRTNLMLAGGFKQLPYYGPLPGEESNINFHSIYDSRRLNEEQEERIALSPLVEKL